MDTRHLDATYSWPGDASARARAGRWLHGAGERQTYAISGAHETITYSTPSAGNSGRGSPHDRCVSRCALTSAEKSRINIERQPASAAKSGSPNGSQLQPPADRIDPRGDVSGRRDAPTL